MVKVRSRKQKELKIRKPKIMKYVVSKLEIGWSPEVISGRMQKDIKHSISFKTIYRYIWEQKQNGSKLYKLLAHQGKRYKYGNANRCMIKDRIDIANRPAIVECVFS
jgi:IS30 family transposase